MQCILLVLSSSQQTRPKVWKGSATSQGLYFQPSLQNTSFNCLLLKSVDDGFDMRWYSHRDCWHGILRQASRGTNNTEAKGLKSTLFPRCGLPGWPWPPRLTDVLFSSCRHVFNYICMYSQSANWNTSQWVAEVQHGYFTVCLHSNWPAPRCQTGLLSIPEALYVIIAAKGPPCLRLSPSMIGELLLKELAWLHCLQEIAPNLSAHYAKYQTAMTVAKTLP